MGEVVRETGVPGEGDEICGKNQTVVGVLPARKDFKSDQLAGPQLNEGPEAGHKGIVIGCTGWVVQVCQHWIGGLGKG